MSVYNHIVIRVNSEMGSVLQGKYACRYVKNILFNLASR